MRNNYKHWRDIPQRKSKRPIPKPFRLLASVWADPSRLKLAVR